MSPIFFKIVVIFFSFIGLMLASFILHKKKNNEKMVCPLDADCRTVINSRFGKFFGIDVALLGIVYYAITAVLYGLFIAFPSITSPEMIFIAIALATGAITFSVYLTVIQAFILKEWCSWCLMSAFISLVIFGVTVFGIGLDIVSLLVKYKTLVVIIHAIAASIGLGAVVITDVFFFRFLKDYRISHEESKTLDTLSQVVWFALGLLIITGLGLFFSDVARYSASTKFLTKAIIVGLLTLNGILLNLFIAPRLVEISFGERHVKQPGELHYLRKIAFALGGVSFTSWFFAFILGSLRTIPLPVWVIFSIYAGCVIVAIIGSQIFDYFVHKRKL